MLIAFMLILICRYKGTLSQTISERAFSGVIIEGNISLLMVKELHIRKAAQRLSLDGMASSAQSRHMQWVPQGETRRMPTSKTNSGGEEEGDEDIAPINGAYETLLRQHLDVLALALAVGLTGICSLV